MQKSFYIRARLRVISFDTETYYDDTCSVVPLGADRYTHHPEFECYMISVCDGQETWSGHRRDFNWDALEGATLVSHNAGFDQAVYRAMVRIGQAPASPRPADWHCTANLAAYITEGLRALAVVVEQLYGVKLDKGMRSWMKGKKWSDAVAAGMDKKLIEYARHDAYWCWKIWNDYKDKWPVDEQKLSQLTIDHGAYGVQVDVPKLNSYLHAVQKHLILIESSLPWREDASPTSTKAIAQECARVGIPAPPVKSDDEEAYLEWEAKFSPQFPWIKMVGDWRSYNKILKSIETITRRLREDGTVECPLKYCGAHTLRWSGESGLNFQNLRKDPIDAAGISIDMRSLFIPRPGKKMITCDLSQIEPRVLAWLSGDTEMLDFVRSGMSVYEAFGRANMGYTGGDCKKERPDLYKLYKAQVLGLGYGCGAEKFIVVAKTLAGLDITAEDSDRIVTDYRSKSTKTTDFWKTLDSAFKRSVGDSFEVDLPSGRKMVYPNVRRGLRIRQDPETGKAKKETCTMADVCVNGVYQRRAMYGGLLTENVVQSLSRDVFAWCLLELERQGHHVLFHVHDEAVCEVDPSVNAKDIEKIMSTAPPWLPDFPLGAEAAEVSHYKK
jgi:hypothetical protein